MQFMGSSPSICSSRQRLKSLTFCGVKDSSRLAAAGLPVDTVGQRTYKVLLRALHDLIPHLVELLGVVDPAVELGVGIGELCGQRSTDYNSHMINFNYRHVVREKSSGWG